MKDLFEELLQTIERTAVDNKATITNVKLFVDSWRKEREMDIEEQLFSMTQPSVRPKPFELPKESEVDIAEGVVLTGKFPLILQNLEGHFVNEITDMLSEYGLSLRVVKRDGIVLNLDNSINDNRVNVEIEKGLITKVNGRG